MPVAYTGGAVVGLGGGAGVGLALAAAKLLKKSTAPANGVAIPEGVGALKSKGIAGVGAAGAGLADAGATGGLEAL